MRKIVKGQEPESLTDWKHKHPRKKYEDLSHIERQDIRQACAAEQYYLCAYCCKEISGNNKDTNNEHIESQDDAPNRTLDFSNIVASCITKKQCNASHGSKHLPLTPLMDECETELEFRLTGQVIGLTDRAKTTINVLNLNNEKLVEIRKQIIDDMLLINGIDNPIDVEDDDLLLSVAEDICSIGNNGKMEAFSPVIANAIKTWVEKWTH